MEDVGKTEKI
jgi:hypothetical protein